MSVAGFRPGFGRGGMIHSLLVREGTFGGVSAAGDVAEVGVGEGLSDTDERRDGVGAAGARGGGDVAAMLEHNMGIKLMSCFSSDGVVSLPHISTLRPDVRT